MIDPGPHAPTTPRRLRLARGVLLALLATACGGDSAPTGGDPAGGRTVLLISLDTLRPERMGCYGGEEGVSPHVDALAAEGVVFEQALAPAPWTLPSHMTMLTGLDPVAHGVHNGGVTLSRHVNTLAEQLADAGFETAAFTDGGFVSKRIDGRASGMDQGFDVFDDARSPDGVNGMRRVAPPAVEWLEDLDADDDAFLFVHSFDAHSFYDSAAPEILERFRARGVEESEHDHHFAWLRFLRQQVKTGLSGYHRLAQLMNDYDAGVHQADLGVGQLLDALRATGRFDDALVIVTSDHGEAFLEHGLHVGHGLGHRDNELRVPLVLKLPGGEGAGTRHDALVGLVDIARTSLDAMDVAADGTTLGESLLGLVRGEPRRTDWLLGFNNNSAHGWVVRGDYRYVTATAIAPMTIAQRHLGPSNPPDFDPADDGGEPYTYDGVTLRYDTVSDPLGLLDVLPGAEQLYDRRADPEEREDRSAAEPDMLSNMRGLFQARRTASNDLFESLRDLEAESASDSRATDNNAKMQAKMIAMLGYAEGDVDISAVPPKMRHWALNPPTAPDTTALLATDRIVHRVRAAILDGATFDATEVRAALQTAGEAYRAWAAAEPAYYVRAEWRLKDLENLAALCGVALDTSAWR